MVNLELYRVFYTVAECGSLSKAAKALFVSQPAISQAIKSLEEQLNVKLFDRSYIGVQLSTEGKLIFSRVKEGLALLDGIENLINEK